MPHPPGPSEHASDGVRALLARLEITRPAFDLNDNQERVRSLRELEELFFEVVTLLQPTAFIEAGAKEAGASRRISAAVPGAAVVAFEANPYTYQRFCKKYDYPSLGVRYCNLALTSAGGMVSFNVRRTTQGRPSADGQGSLLKFKDYPPGHLQVSVPGVTLDSVIDELGAERCALWIDVEGASREVLGGAAETLRRTQALFIEVEQKEYWSGQWLDQQVLSFLGKAGLSAVARDFKSPLQYNAVCVRDDVLSNPGFRQALLAYEMRVLKAAPS